MSLLEVVALVFTAGFAVGGLLLFLVGLGYLLTSDDRRDRR